MYYHYFTIILITTVTTFTLKVKKMEIIKEKESSFTNCIKSKDFLRQRASWQNNGTLLQQSAKRLKNPL